ncbi:MAG: response regulator [Candidatus Sulfotelmatobacter sp.]
MADSHPSAAQIHPFDGLGTAFARGIPLVNLEAKDAMIKILLVEDSKFLRLATERALTRAGYGVTSAVDGEEALLMARQKIPDLILLDMLLPKMSGPDVLKALKQDPDTMMIPVVVMTGMSQKNAPRLQQDGALAFLEKSALELDKGSEKLLSALKKILDLLPNEQARTTSA